MERCQPPKSNPESLAARRRPRQPRQRECVRQRCGDHSPPKREWGPRRERWDSDGICFKQLSPGTFRFPSQALQTVPGGGSMPAPSCTDLRGCNTNGGPISSQTTPMPMETVPKIFRPKIGCALVTKPFHSSIHSEPLLPNTSQSKRPSVIAGGGSSNGSGGSNNTSKTDQSSHSRESGFLSATSLNADVSPASTLTGTLMSVARALAMISNEHHILN